MEIVKHEASLEPAHRLWQEVFSLPPPMITLGFGSPPRSRMNTAKLQISWQPLQTWKGLLSELPHHLLSPLHQLGPEASLASVVFFFVCFFLRLLLLFLKPASYAPLMTEPKQLEVSRGTESSFLAVNTI